MGATPSWTSNKSSFYIFNSSDSNSDLWRKEERNTNWSRRNITYQGWVIFRLLPYWKTICDWCGYGASSKEMSEEHRIGNGMVVTSIARAVSTYKSQNHRYRDDITAGTVSNTARVAKLDDVGQCFQPLGRGGISKALPVHIIRSKYFPPPAGSFSLYIILIQYFINETNNLFIQIRN